VNASASPADQESRRGRLRRDPEHGIIAGVCAGIARRLGVDPILIRVAFVILAIATGGLAALAYVVAWPFIPADSEGDEGADEPSPPSRWAHPANWKVAAGVGLLCLSLLLVLRELGIWWSDALVWPLVLATAGGALLWRQSRLMQPGPDVVRAADEPPTSRSPVANLYRGGFGIALVIGAALLFLSANNALGQTRDVVLAAVAAILALALILAPFLWRLGRNLADERAARIRSQERAELAAHLHDSVLQTLALVQKRAGDQREVAQLARRQERELRSWLFDPDRPEASDSLATALEAAAGEVEDSHGVPIEVVAVGDAPVDERGEALVAATREALVNAAKFAPDAGEIDVYAELRNGVAQVFVRDRGPGFDLGAVPPDRRGVRESIVGRMERFGGRAEVRSRPGAGTEVELTMPRGET
jgi:phage shock protein PspC (stress-responsive transcriptional regulator)/signal transduction histidine kinase